MPEEGEALMDFKRRRRAAEVPLATYRLPEEEMREIHERANRARLEEEERTASMVSAWKEAMEEGLRSEVEGVAAHRSAGASLEVEAGVEEEALGARRTRKELLADLRRAVEASLARSRLPDEEMKGIPMRAKRAREEEEPVWQEAMEEGLWQEGGCTISGKCEDPSQAVVMRVEEVCAGTQSRKELLTRLRSEVQKRRKVEEL